MYDIDLVISFLFMSLLFLRQISILREPHKVNYAPLMITIGAIGSVIHFVSHPELSNLIMLFRESFIPLLVGLLFYLVMNILHQTQEAETARVKDEFNLSVVDNVSYLQDFMNQLDEKLAKYHEINRLAQEEMRDNFKEDIKNLDEIKLNQDIFTEKFDEMNRWHDELVIRFKDFSEKQLPGLESIAHNQISVLRVSEQEHFNQLKLIFKDSFDNRYDLSEDIESLKIDLKNISGLSDKIAKAIAINTLNELSGVSTSFEKQLLLLKSHAEDITTSIQEGDSYISSIRKESEIVMRQMSLSSSKMGEIEKQNDELHHTYKTIIDLVEDIEIVKADYLKSQTQLNIISKEIKMSENEQIEKMKEQLDLMNQQVEILSEVVSAKIEESLEKLHEHYHIADEDITKSVQILSKKAQLKGYIQD